MDVGMKPFGQKNWIEIHKIETEKSSESSFVWASTPVNLQDKNKYSWKLISIIYSRLYKVNHSKCIFYIKYIFVT